MGILQQLYERTTTTPARAALATFADTLAAAGWLGTPVVDPARFRVTATSTAGAVEAFETAYNAAAVAHDLITTPDFTAESDAPVLTWAAVRTALTRAHAPAGWNQATKDLQRAFGAVQVPGDDRERADQAARRWFVGRANRPFAAPVPAPGPAPAPAPTPETLPTPPLPGEELGPRPGPAPTPGLGDVAIFLGLCWALSRRKGRRG
jgi:hypothetical protein